MAEALTQICRGCSRVFTPEGVNASRQCFCTKKCSRGHRGRTPVLAGNCARCHESFDLSAVAVTRRKYKGLPLDTCTECLTSGPGSPTWKGGHRHWSPGRFGRDKDGLSWKTQRRLAWERDNYTCQECGTKPKRNPDVHHIIPFRISQSHALENLKCLCQKCHMQEESGVQERWGGQLKPPPPPKPSVVDTTPRCPVCLDPLTARGPGRLLSDTRIPPCSCTKETARKLRSSGESPEAVAATLGVSIRSVYYWTTTTRG